MGSLAFSCRHPEACCSREDIRLRNLRPGFFSVASLLPAPRPKSVILSELPTNACRDAANGSLYQCERPHVPPELRLRLADKSGNLSP